MTRFTHPFALVLLLACGSASPAPPTPTPTPSPPAVAENATLEYMDPTLPPLVAGQHPKCSLLLFHHDFADTVGLPPVTANYTPPARCPSPWSRVVLELSATASDLQNDRIAGVWLDGAEILRTTTPLPMSPGVFWRVQKDVTRYSALLRPDPDAVAGDGGRIVSMLLENSNASHPGVYSVNVSLHFYRGTKPISAHPTIKRLYPEPADMIIPISNGDDCTGGSWFTVTNETEVQLTMVVVPNNTYRAVLEMYVSHHGEDEYWYVNPLRNTDDVKANGGFRQVVASIDGRYVGSAVPFPVIYPSSINPFFWAPVAAIGAYDHPSYDVDLTPFVGELIDGQPHEFGLTVRESQPYWLVSANLHLWLDAWSDEVEGALVRYKVPPLRLERQADWKHLDGKSELEGQVIIRFSGWVSSSIGNITTNVRHKIKFKSRVEVEDKGEAMTVEMESKARTTVRIEKDDEVIGRMLVDTDAPLQLSSESSNGGGESRYHKTKLYHELSEIRSVEENKAESFSTITDRQESEGSVLMQDGVAVWGKGDTKSTYKFRDNMACYLRTVNMVGGKVKEDEETASCALVAPS